MSSWWHGLSLRERALVGSAGAIILMLIVWYGLVMPGVNARSSANLARQQAADELAQVEHLVAARRARSSQAKGVAVSTGAAMTPDALKTEVTRAAQQAGLSISRLQGSEAGRFSLVFDQADARQLFYWMNDVETRLGGRVERLSMDQGQNGRIRATVELVSGDGA